MEQSLATLSKAAQMLAEIETVDDARQLIDLAEAARYYAKQVGLGLAAQNSAAAIKIRAQRRAGEILDGMESRQGARTDLTIVEPLQKSKTEFYEETGINNYDAHRWQTIAAMPEDKFEEVLADATQAGDELTTAMIYRAARHNRERDLDAITIQPDRAEELRAIWKVETGQCWLLGNHRLVCGDSTDPDILGLALAGAGCDVIITDPPYGMNLDTDYSKMPSTKPEGNKTYSPIIGDDQPFDYQSVLLRCAEEFWFGADYYRKSIPDGGSWLVWDKRVDDKFDAMIGSAFELIWSKNRHKREIIRYNNTLFSGNPEAQNKLHPTEKPTKVIEWIIERYSSRGDIIADLYAGTGTTIISCNNYGRRCIAIEIDPKYIAVALQRWEDATGNKPSLEMEK